ncbi:hypothetical protein TPA0908_54270 [Micromonospora sp. AKA38]|nr:hypothetical protein TPA0908_54270 [Micromonospora sp. AKA38]
MNGIGGASAGTRPYAPTAGGATRRARDRARAVVDGPAGATRTGPGPPRTPTAPPAPRTDDMEFRDRVVYGAVGD